MTWNDFLDRMREAGLEPAEEEFIDDYGLTGSREHAALRTRFFRCMFGILRVDDFRFETYVFPSAAEAEEFKGLLEDGPAWSHWNNLVFHAIDPDPAALERILTRTLRNDAESTGPLS